MRGFSTTRKKLRVPLLGLENLPHSTGQRFDFPQGNHGFLVQRIFSQEQQLGFSEDCGEGIGQIVTQFANTLVLFGCHSTIER